MIYTREMISTLDRLDVSTRALMVYYLDKYYTDYEEPIFRSMELSKIWYLLLVDGLAEEIRTGASHTAQALNRLKLLIEVNSAYYLPHGYEVKLKTIAVGMEERAKAKQAREEAKNNAGI